MLYIYNPDFVSKDDRLLRRNIVKAINITNYIYNHIFKKRKKLFSF